MNYINRIKGRIKRLFAKPRYPATIELSDFTEQKVKFRIHSGTEAFRTLQYGGEREQIEIYVKELRDDDVVYDIGASVGLVSLISAVKSFKGQVVAFEPDPDIMKRLKINIDLNQLKNIITCPFVVTDKNGEINLFTAGSDSVSPSLTGINVMDLELGSISVPAHTLDSLIETKGLPVPDVLKIDVEGAEYGVFMGAVRLLSGEFGKKPRFIFLEAHPDFLRDYDVTLDELMSKIESYGYVSFKTFDREDQLHHFMHLES
ncbi:MAG: FkbM family methyltransferase [Phototrophicaceae bacterium]